MGADLYINSVYDPISAKYTPLFEKACNERNAISDQESAKFKAAQKKVSKYYDLMSSKGYFRDSYNNSSLLWRMDLSWWSDVGELLDEENNLTPAKCHVFLGMLLERPILPIKAEELKDHFKYNKITSKTEKQKVVDEWNEYYTKKKKKLIAFLKLAIKLNESIHCSI
jgi:hypothetical protein